MKLIVLGKYGPYAPAHGATSGYLLENDGKYVLLDMGSGVLARLQEYLEPAGLSGIFLSHIHYDHINDIFLLKYMLEGQREKLNKPLPVFAPSALWDLIKSPVFEFTSIDCCPELSFAGMQISFALMKHPVASYAMRFKNGGDFVYSGDCNSAQELAQFARGCDRLLCDVGTSADKWTPSSPHLHARLAAQAAFEAGASLILTHISPDINQEELLKETRDICSAVCAEERSCYEL